MTVSGYLERPLILCKISLFYLAAASASAKLSFHLPKLVRILRFFKITQTEDITHGPLGGRAFQHSLANTQSPWDEFSALGLNWGGSFKFLNLFSQPGSDRSLCFFKRSETAVRIDAESSLIQRDVAAGKAFPQAIGRNQRCHHALMARPRSLGLIEIEARRRVLEEKWRAPLRKARIAVSASIQEGKLGLQHR